MKRTRPMTVATRSVTVRDYAIFMVKLMLDNARDWAMVPVATVALVLDFVAGRGERPRLLYSVIRMSERFDMWLNLHGAMDRLDDPDNDDGLFGASPAGADTYLGKLEKLVTGKDEVGTDGKGPAAGGGGLDSADEWADLEARAAARARNEPPGTS